jgi:hypothetical protein
MHSNRTVIHPDYVGLGLGMKVINETSQIMYKDGYDVWAKFSSAPVYAAMSKDEKWKLVGIDRPLKMVSGRNMDRKTGFREKVKVYSFHYEPEKSEG